MLDYTKVQIQHKKVLEEKKAAEAKAAALKAAQEAEAARLAAIAAQEAKEAADALQHAQQVAITFTPGNDYTWGNCTWYVANRRAVPPGLGNARDWLYNAPKYGMLTGSTPRVGAVAWHEPGYGYGHVAVVEAINADGSVYISEMNVLGLGVLSYRTLTSTADWQFIY